MRAALIRRRRAAFSPERLFADAPLRDDFTAIQAALAERSAIANDGVYYVKPSTGSNANDGSEGAPFETVTHAMRTATGSASRVVMLEDATIEPWDVRNTDASQSTQQFKWLDGNGFNVTVRVSGPALASETWTQDATYTNCWKTTLSVGASQSVTRVLNQSVSDDYGYDTPLRLYASEAALDGASDAGYFWDNSGKVLWLNIGSDVEAAKANYRALYTNTAGTSRIYLQGASMGLSGVTLEGVQFLLLDAASRRPEIWLHDVTQLWPTSKGADVRGWYVASDSITYASQQDGCNAFTSWAGGESLIQTRNCQFVRSGDRRTFDLNGTLQGISAHGGSDHISKGSTFSENNGQGVADTCAASKTNFTWLQDCTFEGGAAGVTAASIEFGSAASGAARHGFLDACTSSSATTDLLVNTNGYAYGRNNTLPTITGTLSGWSDYNSA